MTHFNGPEYKTKSDHTRLEHQHERVKRSMMDHKWRSLQEIADITHDPVASISAQLRHLRKERFGGHTVERRSRGRREGGLFEYRLISEGAIEPKTKKKTKCSHCNGKGYL